MKKLPIDSHKTKIAVLSFYSGINSRGVETWVYELFSRLSNNFNITVFQAGENSIKTKYNVIKINLVDANKQINKVRKLDFLGRFYFDLQSLLILKFTLKLIPDLIKGNYDIVIPTDGGWEPAFIRLITWFTGKKMIIVGHSGKGWDERNNLWSFPDKFIALTKFAQEWAKKVNPFVNVENIPNGVDTLKFNPMGKKVDIKLERPVYLAVSALEKGKRLDLLILAISKLKKGSLIILGKGSEKENLETLANKLLPKRSIIKSVKFSEVAGYYRSADVFSLPSWSNEAFGIVYLEAMSSGLPVVATSDSARKEIVGDAGILIDPQNVEAYSKALKDVINGDYRDKALNQSKKFTWDVVATKYSELFNNLI